MEVCALLEVRELKKIYKTKKGADVHALDGVTLKFPEKGMVFLLGKSGSGKSTLLNVCGGLDSPSGGEIIVKGRSSKDFSQSDFDSYRNTFIGFIFQEYNILNEFSVEDNIALALELQGKPKDKKAINALLEEVDLAGYAKRKPNTLSGGQKQRIAIARALIKSPEIIMADEPTGALDSKTGKQVFETLKKLSEKKLVIVVSHDRDFAEQYGDRIIELSDGKVISDVSKTEQGTQKLSDNISSVGDVLCIKNGAELSDSDFEKIKGFLKKSNKDILIARDENDIKSFKKVNRINDEGGKEVFAATAENAVQDKSYTKEESRFIRSKLPLRHAFKIGVSGLRLKPLRLFFTILLCTVAFVLFGLLSTLNFYKSEATFKQTLIDSQDDVPQLSKSYEAEITWYSYGAKEGSYEMFYETKFTEEELEKIKNELDPDAFGGVRSYSNFRIRQADSQYWVNSISAFAYLPESSNLRGKIEGSYPTQNNELVISSYFAELLKNCKPIDESGSAIEVNNINELIGKNVYVNDTRYKIVGIIDVGMIPAEYEQIKEAGFNDYSLISDYQTFLNSGLHLIVFTTPDRLQQVADEQGMMYDKAENYTSISSAFKIGGKFNLEQYSNAKYASVKKLSEKTKLYPINGDAAISDGEVILPTNAFASNIANIYRRLADDAHNSGNYTKGQRYSELSQMADILYMGGEYFYEDKENEPVFDELSDSEYDELLTNLISAIKQDSADLTFGLRLFDDMNQAFLGELESFSVAALYKQTGDNRNGFVYLSDSTFERLWNQQKGSLSVYSDIVTKYVENPDALYSVIYLPGKVEKDKVDKYWEVYKTEEAGEDGSRITLGGGFVNNLKMVDSLVKELSKVFLYVGIVLAIFAALLLSNFISVSISHKKREIGILRAVGARSFDVFKIFFSESFVIAFICIIFSSLATSAICGYINSELGKQIGASLFVFGPLSLAVLVGVAFITTIVATFLPVYNAAKKKPVDSIRSL